MPLADLLHGLAELDEHAPDYETARQYAEGERGEVFASPRMRRAMAATGTTYRVNLAQIPIKVLSGRLEIAAVTVPDDDAATQQVEDIWDRNELDTELPGAIRKACEYGDAYLMVWPGDEPNTADIWVRTPLTTRVIYDPENPRRKSYAVFAWAEGAKNAKRRRCNVLYDDRTEKYVTLPGRKGTEPGDWTEYQPDGEAWPLPHPDGIDEVPVYHLRTDRPYGRPVHKDSYGPQDLVTKLIISDTSGVDYQAAPQRYALAEAAVDTDDDAGIDFGLDDASAVAPAEGESPVSKLKSGPGELWYLEGVKSVGQFEPPAPNLITDRVQLYVRLLSVVTDVPLHYFDPSGDQPSGESRRVANEPLVKAVGMLKVAFASPLKRAFALALKLSGYPDADVDVRWVPNETPDGLEAWQTIAAKIEAGVPVRQALLEAGYTTAQVDDWLTESEDEDVMRRILALKELGSATQSLGTAVGFGVVTVEQVQRAVAALLGEDPAAVQAGQPAPGAVATPGGPETKQER
jgi:hypothetical protein